MLALISNLNLVTRMEINVSSTVQDTLLQGFWVTPGGAKYVSDGSGTDTHPGQGFQVWTEANRTMEKDYAGGTAIGSLGSTHFTGDATGKTPETLTCLYGKYRALTNIYTGSPDVGEALFVDANGVLKVDATPSGVFTPVAVCTKTVHTYNSHLGDVSCIEFVTV